MWFQQRVGDATLRAPGKAIAPRVQSVHDLRGLAALAVLVFHLSGSVYVGLPPAVSTVVSFGQYGVTAFFVISGFVLPYSLFQSDYRVRDFGGFLMRRVVRVEPPYVVACVMVVGLNILLGLIKHNPVRLDWVQIALHVAYLAPAFGKPWLISVFWTLCVEFQFYALIGLLYPVVLRWPLAVAVACAAAMMLSVPAWFPAEQLPLGQRENILAHLPVFMVGMAVFLRRERLIAPGTFALVVALSLATIALKAPPGALYATVIALLVIVFFQHSHRILAFFGDISYSLYLVHLMVILTVLPMLKAYGLGWVAMSAIALVVSVAAASGLWLIVELPAIRLSKWLKVRAMVARAASAAPPRRRDH